MIDLTFEQLFGKGATQDIATITIQKSSLPKLTPTSIDRPTQLFAAILLQGYQHFQGELTDEQGVIVIDEQGRSINFDNRGLYQKLNIWFWKHQFIKQETQTLTRSSFIINCFVKPLTEPKVQITADYFRY